MLNKGGYMQDLDFRVNQTAGKIECNFAELKQALAVQMSAYDDAVVTEDSIPSYKAEIATLRKIRKAVDEKRKDIKRDFLAPLDEFVENVKLLLEEIDKPINLINSQLTLFEEDRKLNKKERVSKMYIEQVGDYLEFLPIESNFNEKWLNKGYSDSDIVYDISEKIQKVKNDLTVIDGLNSEIREELIKTYISSNNDLSRVVARNSQYLADKKRVEESVKKEIESKAESKEIEAESKSNSLTKLNEFVKQSKTVKLIISETDLAQVQELLDFSDIKYQIIKE